MRVRERVMPYTVDFNNVSTVGLESSPVAAALAGLRANEARYFKNKYDHVFTVDPASDAKTTIDWVHRILKEERDVVIPSRPLVATIAPDLPSAGSPSGLPTYARTRRAPPPRWGRASPSPAVAPETGSMRLGSSRSARYQSTSSVASDSFGGRYWTTMRVLPSGS